VTIRALLLDLQGVLFDGRTPIPGAVEAVTTARRRGLLLRFVTNTATRHPAEILMDLRRMGFSVEEEELFTAPMAARALLHRHGWRPHCLVHPAIAPLFTSTQPFPSCPTDAQAEAIEAELPDCVVLGDARDGFTYEALNQVFRLVMMGKPLVGIGRNRCFREGGQWMLDAGAFIEAIEWASRSEAIIVGKPSPTFFDELIASTGCCASECLMVGDDVEADVNAAIDRGLRGCLVRTGKFKAGDESLKAPSALLIASIARIEAVLD
jgi:HAD superfamily hydrolase (TIGR01458 family)